MKVQTITITGEAQGTIWMPAAECTKEFSERFRVNSSEPFAHEWEGIRDALLQITNDSDFQECGISWAYIEYSGINKYGRTVSLGYALRPGRATGDLFAPNGLSR